MFEEPKALMIAALLAYAVWFADDKVSSAGSELDAGSWRIASGFCFFAVVIFFGVAIWGLPAPEVS